MISLTFANKIVMAMHIVTIEHSTDTRRFTITLSNGLILWEEYTDEAEMMVIARKLAFDERKG